MKKMDPATEAVMTAIRGVRAAGYDPASDEGQRHLHAVIGPVLHHMALSQQSVAEPPAGDDQTPDDDLSARLAAGRLTMADVDSMTAEQIAANWDAVAAVIRAARGAKS